MKILMINKFLYPNGGSETYIFKLGEELIKEGHEVQYFGMEHEGRCVGNRVNAYTSDMDFHNGSKLSKLTYPIKTIYSSEARRQIRKVLDDFKPDVCHLNNFNYQLTPSIILEIVKWRKETNHQCKIVYTAHDYQLVCPNHMLHNPNTHENCKKCLTGSFFNCVKGKCIHGSTAKSFVGYLEAKYWNTNGVYKYIDTVICPSKFVKNILDEKAIFKGKTVAIHNFIAKSEESKQQLEIEVPNRYVLYFGRYSTEKGIQVLVDACKKLPNIQFVFAGDGPEKHLLNDCKNVINVGFQSGDTLNSLIRKAEFSLCPSTWYEVYGLNNAESIEKETPVLATNIGGIPEVVNNEVNGELVNPADVDDLAKHIDELWNSKELLTKFKEGCKETKSIYVDKYAVDVKKVYGGA